MLAVTSASRKASSTLDIKTQEGKMRLGVNPPYRGGRQQGKRRAGNRNHPHGGSEKSPEPLPHNPWNHLLVLAQNLDFSGPDNTNKIYSQTFPWVSAV
jgi:hypothetical protein